MADKKHSKSGKGHSAEGRKKPGKEGPVKSELEELKETLQRVQAEFENSRKRLEKEKHEFSKLANATIVKELLPLLDSMEAAENGIREQDNVSKDEAVEGIELLKKQLLAILRSHGLEEIECLEKCFDPMLHDCVMQGKEKEKKDEIVLEELQKGYLLNGKVLRHSKVKVNKI